MADVSVKFSVSKNILKQLRDELFIALGKKGRGNFSDVRPIVSDAIDQAVEVSRNLFIPTDSEAAELGVGENGQIDRNKTEGAYRHLLADSPEKITTFSAKKTGRGRSALIGKITVDIDFDRLFATELATVQTDSEFPEFENIHWLQWLLRGAPRVSGFSFDARRTGEFSRTGAGLMVQLPGGLWQFPPARPGAEDTLFAQIERNIEDGVEKKVGRILNA